MRGKFITIEGTEGAGKSTALQCIQEFLKAHHLEFILTREPGGTPLAEEIRNVLLHPVSQEIMRPETELLLMFAARAQHISQCIEPALSAGKWVVSDRYIDASYAYQGGGRQMDLTLLKTLDNYIVGDLYPDLTLLLDLPVAIGAARAEKRGAPKDRIEQEKEDFFERIRTVYLQRAQQDSRRIKVIDSSPALADVQQQIQQVLTQFFNSIKEKI